MCVTIGSGASGASETASGSPPTCCSCRQCPVCAVCAYEVRAAALAPSSSARACVCGGPASIVLLFNLAVDPSLDAIELAHFKGPEPTIPKCSIDKKATAAQCEKAALRLPIATNLNLPMCPTCGSVHRPVCDLNFVIIPLLTALPVVLFDFCAAAARPRPRSAAFEAPGMRTNTMPICCMRSRV